MLNSLAGEAIRKGLAILRPYGRFVELGKRDFYADSKLGLSPFRNNIQFFGVDIDRLLADRPALARELFEELASLLDRGVFHPLPHRVFPIARAGDAFRSMQQSRHIGKIVVAMSGPANHTESAAKAASPQSRLRLSPDATYLVTGARRVRPRDGGMAGAQRRAPPRSARPQPDHRARRRGRARPLRAMGSTPTICRRHRRARQLAEVLQRGPRDLPPLRGTSMPPR